MLNLAHTGSSTFLRRYAYGTKPSLGIATYQSNSVEEGGEKKLARFPSFGYDGDKIRRMVMGAAGGHYSNIKTPYISGSGRLPSGLPELKRNFSLSELHERHHEIARRLVLGQKPKDIAEDLKLSYASVVSVKNLPVVQEQIALLSGARDSEVVDVAKQIRELAPECVRILKEDILECDDNSVSKSLKAKTCFDLLDRAGHAAPKSLNINAVHAIVTPQDLMAIKQRAAEIAMDNGVIDVEQS